MRIFKRNTERPANYITEIPKEVFQIPGIENIVIKFQQKRKIYRIYVNGRLIFKLKGMEAVEANTKLDTPVLPKEYFQANRACLRVCGFNLDQLKIKSRKREIVEARQISMTWIFMNSNLTLKEVGELFQPKNEKAFDHATVIHAKKTVLNDIETNKTFAAKYKAFVNIANQPIIKSYETN